MVTRRLPARPVRHARAYTYVAVLLLLAVHGVVLAIAGATWHSAQQREKERELLFVGDQFRSALRSYAHSGAGVAGQLPRSLDDLLRDPRYPGTKRHLRKVFVDPMTGKAEWGLLRTPDGMAITGVFSTSQEAPIKRANFEGDDEAFEGAARYSEWKFQYPPAHPPPAAPAQPANPSPAPPAAAQGR